MTSKHTYYVVAALQTPNELNVKTAQEHIAKMLKSDLGSTDILFIEIVKDKAYYHYRDYGSPNSLLDSN